MMHGPGTPLEKSRDDRPPFGSEAGGVAHRQWTADLNQIFRRLRHYENEEQWVAAVRDGSAKFAGEFGVFSCKEGVCLLRAQQNLNVPKELAIPLSSARAFSAAAESGEPVLALRRPGEVGELLGTAQGYVRAHIFPISNGGRTVAVIFAAENPVLDIYSLELITGMASAVLERRANAALHSQISPAPSGQALEPKPSVPASAPQIEKKRSVPAWADLSEHERSLHINARRFSRVAVAKMQLARPEACRAGREQNTLYMFLQAEIDKARESYRRQFMTLSPKIDYLHLELVAAAAHGDEQKLGVDYPGQLE